MKKLIVTLIVLAIAVPSLTFAIQKFERTGKIETDEHGGYSESQRDYKHRRVKQIDDKTGSGYYNGEYHATGDKCTDKEWQFMECNKGGSAKSYKKVKEKKTK